MNLFSPILRLFGIGSLSNKDTGPQYGSTARISTDAGISVTDERALQVSAVWACTQYIVNSLCSLPLGVYRKNQDGTREEVTSHYLVDLLLKSPNQLMKPRDFRKAMTTQMVLWSNAYAEIFWNSDGTRPLGMVPLRPARMTPFISPETGMLEYHYQMEQGIRVYSSKSILHLKGFGTDGVVGLQRNDYARNVTGLSVSADVYAAKQFAHGGRSGGGYLMFDTFLTPEQREQAEQRFSGMSETSYEKGKVWILEGGSKFDADTVNPDTMQMIETRNMQVSEIARFYGVPDVLLGTAGTSKGAWPASFEQQLLSFLTFTLQDYMDEWEHAVKHSLLTGVQRDRYFIDHDVTNFIKMDSQAKANLQSTWVQNGLKSRNEIRKINNDPPVDGGDELTVQVNLTTLEKLGEEPEPQEMVPVVDEQDEMRQRMTRMEFKQELLNLVNKQETPHVFNITLPENGPPEIKVQNDFKMPKQAMPVIPTPVVNVQNDVHVPAQQPPDVNVENQIDVPASPPPDVKVTNKIDLPSGKSKQVTFQHDANDNVISARIKEN